MTASKLSILALSLLVLVGLGRAEAVTCGKDPSQFPAWLESFKAYARSQGISDRTIQIAFQGVTYDPQVIRLDRNQKHFKQPFEVYSKRVVSPGRIARGKQLMQQYSRTLDRIEQTGVLHRLLGRASGELGVASALLPEGRIVDAVGDVPVADLGCDLRRILRRVEDRNVAHAAAAGQ